MKAGLQARFRPQHCKSPSTPKPPRIWRAHDPCRQLLLLCWCASVAHSRPGSSDLVATQERIPACSDCGRAAGNRGFRLARRLEFAVMWRRQRPAIRSALDRNSHMPPNPTTPIVPVFAKPGVLNRLLQSLSIFTMVMTVPQVLTIWVSHRSGNIHAIVGRVPRLRGRMVLVRITEARQEHLLAMHRLDVPRHCRACRSFDVRVRMCCRGSKYG